MSVFIAALRICFSMLLVSVAVGPCRAGAFPLAEGEGQFIAGVGYTEASRRFDATGQIAPTSRFTKTEVEGYLEYGVTSRFGMIVVPTFARERDTPTTNAFNGSDGSSFGGRYQLLSSSAGVLAVQALVQPPIGSLRYVAGDVRVMAGQSFKAFGLNGFVDLEPGMRFRGGPLPTEARFDVALGIRLRPAVLLLLQSFSSIAPAGPRLPRTSYTKVQGSVVYDFSRTWSGQLGIVRAIFGRNAVRETGPIVAIWHRF